MPPIFNSYHPHTIYNKNDDLYYNQKVFLLLARLLIKSPKKFKFDDKSVVILPINIWMVIMNLYETDYDEFYNCRWATLGKEAAVTKKSWQHCPSAKYYGQPCRASSALCRTIYDKESDQ